MGYTVVAEKPAGPYRLDCWLSEVWAAIEYDGPAHWRRQDAKRDAWLWDTYRIMVLRVTDLETLAQAIAPFFDEALLTVSERKVYAIEHGWHG